LKGSVANLNSRVFNVPVLTESDLWACVMGLASLFVAGRRLWRSLLREPSYGELVLKKEQLEYAVTFWRYPDGGHAPLRKRLRLMRELRVVSRRLDALAEPPREKP
jgi:hypothetical protein